MDFSKLSKEEINDLLDGMTEYHDKISLWYKVPKEFQKKFDTAEPLKDYPDAEEYSGNEDDLVLIHIQGQEESYYYLGTVLHYQSLLV